MVQTTPLDELFALGGAMGALMRAADWSATPLGSSESWPQSLRTALGICLTSPLPIVLWWGPQRVSLYNDACAQLIGEPKFSSDPLRQGSWENCPSLVPVTDPTPGELAASPIQGLRVEGESRFFQVACSPIFGETGAILGQLALVISETPAQPSLQQQLQASEELNRRIVNTSPDCIKILDLDGRLLSMNASGRSLFGIDDFKAFVGDSWIDFWPEGEQPAARQALLAAKAGKIARFQGHCPTLTGQPKWWDVVTVSLLNPQGQAEKLLCIARDISDLKQAEAALEGSEARYRSIFENAGVSIWIEDFSQLKTWLDELKAGGITDLRAYFQDCPAALEQAIELVTVTEVNQHSLKLFGATSKEELLASLTRIFTAATRSVFLEEVLALADGCRYFEAETRLKTLRGQSIHVFFTLAFPESDSYDRVLVSILDISDRKLVEDALRWREEELRLIANAIPALIAYVTTEGRYRFVNRAYTHWFGRPAEEILGQSVKDFMGEEAYSLMERDIETALSGQVVTAELWVSFPTVGRRYVRREYIPDFDEMGQTKGFYAFNNDLTDLKLAEENLRQSEARFRHMAETIEDVFWIAERHNYRFLYVSPAYERIWGRSCASLYQNPSSWLESICLEDREQVRRAVQQLQQADRFDLEYRIRREDGSIRWIRDRGFPMAVSDGTSACLAGLAEDITDRKAAAAALEKSHERLALLYGIANQLLLHEQPETFIAHLFEQLSAHLELEFYFNYLLDEKRQKLYLNTYGGVSEATANQMRWLDLGHAVCGTVALQMQQRAIEDLQDCQEPMTDALRRLGVRAHACYPLLAGKRLIGTFSFGTSKRPRFEPDELALMETVCEQVATVLERSRLRSELQQRAEELARANRLKDEFLAVLSHELRTPLNPILGWAGMLQRYPSDSQVLSQAAGAIERNVKLQVQLIDDLLDISRILQGKLNLRLESVDIESVARAALETMRLAIEAKNLHLETDCQPNLPPVLGDPGRLQQVVWNLLANAVKFTPSGGRVTMRLALRDSLVQIQVEDNGQGIDPQFLPHVFEYFRQEDGTMTRQFGGLGLGLAIVRHITEMHGGTVSVTSAGKGLGATFTLLLPCSAPDVPITASDSAATEHSLPSLVGVEVLLVEDDPDTRELTTFLLEQAGARTIAVASAADALNCLAQSAPNILVCDIAMLQMDGYQLLQQVRAQPQYQKLPAIAVTACAGPKDAQYAIQAGFNQHLSKPIPPQRLLAAIEQLMRSQPEWRSPPKRGL